MPELFTIGYEGADPAAFLEHPPRAGVESVADVQGRGALAQARVFRKNA